MLGTAYSMATFCSLAQCCQSIEYQHASSLEDSLSTFLSLLLSAIGSHLTVDTPDRLKMHSMILTFLLMAIPQTAASLNWHNTMAHTKLLNILNPPLSNTTWLKVFHKS